ncbi:MAG: sigma-70 family RNA polymerase sigma factor [Chitinophagales bacterium]
MNDNLIDLKTENNFAFGKLYQKNFHKISKFVVNNSGNKADTEDLFQDAMMVLVEKLRKDNFQLTASINTYVFAICKNLWFKKLRDRKFDLSIDEIQSTEFLSTVSDAIEKEKTYTDKLKEYLLNATDHCNKLIHDIFFKNKAIEQIQKEYGYTTRHNAQNQKHKCVEQLRRIKEQEK